MAGLRHLDPAARDREIVCSEKVQGHKQMFSAATNFPPEHQPHLHPYKVVK